MPPFPFPLIIISGPSGVGKTILIKRLRQALPALQVGVTYTTRPRRAGKKEDKIMRYISREEFERMISQNDFLEHAIVHNEYYGTSRHELTKRLGTGPVLLNLDVQGAWQVKRFLPHAHLIFIQPGSWPELKARILRRGRMTQKELQLRLDDARHELRYLNRYDYLITNSEGKLDKAVAKLTKTVVGIIQKTRG